MFYFYLCFIHVFVFVIKEMLAGVILLRAVSFKTVLKSSFFKKNYFIELS